MSCIGTVRVHDEQTDSVLFAYVEKEQNIGKLIISEITPNVEGSKKFRKIIDMTYPDGSELDFPVFMSIQEALGIIFLFTK